MFHKPNLSKARKEESRMPYVWANGRIQNLWSNMWQNLHSTKGEAHNKGTQPLENILSPNQSGLILILTQPVQGAQARVFFRLADNFAV